LARLKNLFGDDYKQGIYDSYCGDKKDQKTPDDILNEVWHILFSFDDVEKVKEYARGKLGLDDESAGKFSTINLSQGYGALSLKAIRKIFPFLKQGLLYSHAVFFANLDQVIGVSANENEKLKTEIAKLIDEHNRYIAQTGCVNEFVREYKKSPQAFEEKYDLCDVQAFEAELPSGVRDSAENICMALKKQVKLNDGNGEYLAMKRLEERVGDYLMEEFQVTGEAVTKLYHPSAI
jgi:CRISPR-associated endonuclease Csn1